MKSFKMTAYQTGAELSLEFELANDKARPSIIVGTAINDFFRKFDAAKAFGAKLFDSRQPVNLRITSLESGDSVDSALLDEGVTGVKSSFTDKLKLNSSASSKMGFAKKIWIGYNLLTQPVIAKRIEDVISEKWVQHSEILALRKAAKELANKPTPKLIKADIEEIKAMEATLPGADLLVPEEQPQTEQEVKEGVIVE